MLNELQPVLKYGVIIGLVPYACIRQQQKQHKSQQHLHWQQIYTLLILSANLVLTLHTVIFVPLEVQIVSNLVSLLVYLHQVFAMSVILLEGMLTYDQHLAFMQKSQRLQQLFYQQLQLHLCGSSISRHRLRHILLIQAPLTYGSLIVNITIISIVAYSGYFYYGLLSVLIIRTRCLQAVLYVDYITFYLDMLNLKLRAVYSCKVAQQRDYLDVNYAKLESLDYLLTLKCIYKEVYEFAMIYNEFFGWSLVVALTVVFFEILVHVYWTSLTLGHYYNHFSIYMNFFSFLPLGAILFMLCYSGDRCKMQSHETALLVQRLLSTSLYDVNTKLYSDLLNEFSLQIMQDRIEICPKGFCCIDLRLFTEIFVSMVTYLVILMQFSSETQPTR